MYSFSSDSNTDEALEQFQMEMWNVQAYVIHRTRFFLSCSSGWVALRTHQLSQQNEEAKYLIVLWCAIIDSFCTLWLVTCCQQMIKTTHKLADLLKCHVKTFLLKQFYFAPEGIALVAFLLKGLWNKSSSYLLFSH